MNVFELVEAVKSGAVSAEEHTHKVLEEAKKVNKQYNYFNVISEELALSQARNVDKKVRARQQVGMLAGVPVSVKDSICVKDVESCAGSRILKGYFPLFNATAVERAILQDAVIIGKTAQDEFGFGGYSMNTGIGFKIPRNPVEPERVCGGSSGGAAGWARKTAFPHIAFGESTGGSIVNPASFCGVAGLCPTYGRISRYGLIDYGSSLDKIGPIAKTVAEAFLLLKVSAGIDSNDSTTANVAVPNYADELGRQLKGLKIGMVKEAFGSATQQEVSKLVLKRIDELASRGAVIGETTLPVAMKYGIPTYFVSGLAEASTNLAKFCGMRYGAQEKLEGSFDEYFTKVRSNNLGPEAKRRILLGTFARMAGYRDAFYTKAMQVRTKIIEEYQQNFKKFDILVTPTVPVVPPLFSEVEKLTPLQHYMIDALTVGPNIAGIPQLSVNAGEANGLPVGMMLLADHFKEGLLARIGSAYG